MRRILKKIKEKKGMSTIEFAIGMLILFGVLVFIIDLSKIAYVYYIANQQLNYVSRTIGIEGGVHATEPSGFPETYYTSSQVLKSMENTFGGVGVEPSDFSVIIKDNKTHKSVKLTPVSNITVDYTKGVDVELHVKYKWSLFGQIVPSINKDREFVVKRYVVSEFKYNYNDWNS